MRYIKVLLTTLIFMVGTTVNANTGRQKDLTILEYPLLIGEWYYISEGISEANEPDAMRILLNSDRHFSMQMVYPDHSSQSWQGDYSVNKQQIMLNVDDNEPEIYDYSNNQNQLILNGVSFYKLPPPSLPGVWHSELLSGSDIQGRAPSQLTLILQPDFVFFIHSSDDDGHEVVRRGVYNTESDHLVLFYHEGGVDTKYSLNQDTLTWNIDDGALKAVMTRMKQ